MSFIWAALLLFLVMDPFGNIPLFLIPLTHVPDERRRKVLARELLIALAILVFFLFFGCYLMKLLAIDGSSVGIAGGVVLFLIAIKMVFGRTSELYGQQNGDREPFIVPLATPYVAGPSAIAVVMLLMAKDSSRWYVWLGALVAAWSVSSIILIASSVLNTMLKPRTIVAVERLMGLILTILAVNMLLRGIATFLQEHSPGR